MSKESDDKLAGEIVAAMRQAFHNQRARAAHAKGIVLEGRFVPTDEAATLSEAALFDEPSLPITVRFSDFTGLPDIADTDDFANPRGMAVRFHAGGRDNLDIVTHSFNGFPSATAQDFRDLMRALAESPPGTAKPTPLDTYLAGHPAARTFLATQKPPPVSFATAAYFAANAVTFDDGAGGRCHVRHRFVPHAGERTLDAATRATRGPNYLFEEIAQRLGVSVAAVGPRLTRARQRLIERLPPEALP